MSSTDLLPPSEVLTPLQAMRYLRESLPVNVGLYFANRLSNGTFVMSATWLDTHGQMKVSAIQLDGRHSFTKARCFDVVEMFLRACSIPPVSL